MIGSHFFNGWSRTQNHVTMSSAEAELIALVKCTAELLGMRSLMRDWGTDSRGLVYADSTAALAIAKRKGAGKLPTAPAEKSPDASSIGDGDDGEWNDFEG